jgi:transposase-like protein
VLVELGMLEQRHKAVLEVMAGATVTDVARRYGVARQTLHDWLRRYAKGGMAALSDCSSKPATCPHQMPPEIEARACALRREHPAWGPQTILYHLAKDEASPPPSRSGIYRALVRHNLIEPTRRRRQRGDYKRWERSRPMELWQMDIVGGVKLTDGGEASIVMGIDAFVKNPGLAVWASRRIPLAASVLYARRHDHSADGQRRHRRRRPGRGCRVLHRARHGA